MDRLDALRSMVSQDPRNTLVRYGLAMEYAKAGQYSEAVAEYNELLSFNPDYCYAYFHGGQALEKLGRIEDARQMYLRGIETATRTGDDHARSELQGALEGLG